MLGSARSWNSLRSCSAGRDEVVPGPWRSGLWDMGTAKATIGFLVIIACVYAAFQIVPPELSNYSFQDDLRAVALTGGANPHTTDQELADSVIKKAGAGASDYAGARECHGAADWNAGIAGGICGRGL
jgi:hypothetical protein